MSITNRAKITGYSLAITKTKFRLLQLVQMRKWLCNG